MKVGNRNKRRIFTRAQPRVKKIFKQELVKKKKWLWLMRGVLELVLVLEGWGCVVVSPTQHQV